MTDLERADEILNLWLEWYGSNRKNSLAPSVATREFLDRDAQTPQDDAQEALW